MASRGWNHHDQLSSRPFQRQGDTVRLLVRVTPRAGRTAVAGLVQTADGQTALAVRLAAPPVDGAANAALIDLLASRLRLPKSAIRIVNGETGRLKRLEIDDVSEEALDRLTA